jgi:hypothetical protein
MDQREICAEKIRAVSPRARYRDFYDLYFLINDLRINVDEAIIILRQKEIRSPVSAGNIIRNWSVAKEQMDSYLGSIYRTEEVTNTEIEKLVRALAFEDIEVNV